MFPSIGRTVIWNVCLSLVWLTLALAQLGILGAVERSSTSNSIGTLVPFTMTLRRALEEMKEVELHWITIFELPAYTTSVSI